MRTDGLPDRQQLAIYLYSIVQEYDPRLPERTEWGSFSQLEKLKLLGWADKLLVQCRMIGS